MRFSKMVVFTAFVSSLTRWISCAFATAAILAAMTPAYAEVLSIDFERTSHPRALPGTVATNLYSPWGVTFPSAPVIEFDIGRNQALRQGTASGGPDPIPRRVRCAPLIIQFDSAIGVREVRLRALNRHLRAYSVTAHSRTGEVDAFNFYPPRETRPRPFPLAAYRDVVLRAGVGEGDIVRVEANPPSDCFDLMVIDNLAFDAARPPVLPNIVWASAFEVNQGVMPRLTAVTDSVYASVPDTRLMALPAKRLPFVRNRNTVARFFLSSSRADIPNYAARLRVTVTNTDGTTTTQTINENTIFATGAPSPSEPQVMQTDWTRPDADIRHQMITRRGRGDQSHDFVLPASQLRNAARADLRLLAPDGEQLAWVRVDLTGPFTIGLNFFRVQGVAAPGAVPIPRGIGGPVPLEPTRGQIRSFMRDLMPVSGNVRAVNRGVLNVTLGPATANCNALLTALSAAAVGIVAVPSVNYWSNMFVAQFPPGCGGFGWYNTPGALTNPALDTASHEVSHNIGINHASNLHGELARGDWETWPYFHGSIGTVDETQSFLHGVYGAVMTQRSVAPAADWGAWVLDVVVPCPVTAPATEWPTCGLADVQIVHDYMSYGPRTPMPTYGNVNWNSDVNFYRVYRFLEDCTALDPPHRFATGSTATFIDSTGECSAARTAAGMAGAAPAGGGAPSVDMHVFSGIFSRDGKIDGFRALRKRGIVPLSNKRGAYALILRAADGKVIRTVPFDALVAADADGVRAFVVATPFEARLAHVEIREGQRLVFERKASPARPEINLVSPKAGEVWRQGKQRIAWQQRDADGDKLETFVQYSTDGGKSWSPLAVLEGGITELAVDVADLTPSKNALIYVSVSDGLNSSAALSAGVFTISNIGQSE